MRMCKRACTHTHTHTYYTEMRANVAVVVVVALVMAVAAGACPGETLKCAAERAAAHARFLPDDARGAALPDVF